MSLYHALRKRGQPPVRFPLKRVFSPQRLILINCCNADENFSAFRDGKPVHVFAKNTFNGILQG